MKKSTRNFIHFIIQKWKQSEKSVARNKLLSSRVKLPVDSAWNGTVRARHPEGVDATPLSWPREVNADFWTTAAGGFDASFNSRHVRWGSCTEIARANAEFVIQDRMKGIRLFCKI